MAIDFGLLMNITESAHGWYRGNYDAMPGLDLNEAFAAGSSSMLELRLDDLNETAEQNEALVEAVIRGYNTDTLVESAFETAKNKISEILKRIIDFFKSIVAKLKVQIDKIRLNGNQLYSRYADSKEYKDKNFDGLEFEGYEFKNHTFPDTSKYEATGDALKTLIKNAYGDNGQKVMDQGVTTLTKSANQETLDRFISEAKSAIDGVKTLKGTEIQAKVAGELVGMADLKGSEWASTLKKKLYGNKTTLRYGKHFSRDTIARLLKDPANLDEIKKEYDRIAQAVADIKEQTEREMDDAREALSKERDENTPADPSDQAATKLNSSRDNALSKYAELKKKYVEMVSEVTAAINQVKQIKFNYMSEQINQAKKIFGKMLSYKGKKTTNSSYGDDELYGEFDFAI